MDTGSGSDRSKADGAYLLLYKFICSKIRMPTTPAEIAYTASLTDVSEKLPCYHGNIVCRTQGRI
jgi:hypothetical protein